MKWIRLIKIVFVLIGVIIASTGGCLNVCEWPNQIAHRIDLPSTIQPDHPEIMEINEDYDKGWPKLLNRYIERNYSTNEIIEKELERVERFVEDRIPYCSEIENPDYPAFEHFPTISQALENGDDCDGMAIVACSLLIQRGYNSYVILNERHAWVITYLDDGSFKEILNNSNQMEDHSWLLQWNNCEIKINSANPYLYLLIGLVSLLILRKRVFRIVNFKIQNIQIATKEVEV